MEQEVRRKKDWVTFLAISLFVLIIVFEVGLVTLLPFQLRSEKMWEKEVAFQEMVSLEDFLRAKMIDFKKRNQFVKGNTGLMKTALDGFAEYLRAHRDDISREQIRDIQNQLLEFEKIYMKMKHRKLNITKETLNPTRYLDHLLSKCETAVPPEYYANGDYLEDNHGE